jgi:hypothetical protein
MKISTSFASVSLLCAFYSTPVDGLPYRSQQQGEAAALSSTTDSDMAPVHALLPQTVGAGVGAALHSVHAATTKPPRDKWRGSGRLKAQGQDPTMQSTAKGAAPAHAHIDSLSHKIAPQLLGDAEWMGCVMATTELDKMVCRTQRAE